MVNYAVNDWSSDIKSSIADALADLETQLETIDDSKTIRLIDVKVLGGKYFQAILVTDA